MTPAPVNLDHCKPGYLLVRRDGRIMVYHSNLKTSSSVRPLLYPHVTYPYDSNTGHAEYYATTGEYISKEIHGKDIVAIQSTTQGAQRAEQLLARLTNLLLEIKRMIEEEKLV